MAGSPKQRPQTAGDQSAEVCCRECGTHLKYVRSLVQHFKGVHDEEVEFVRFCEECGGRFSAPSPKTRLCSDRCSTNFYRADDGWTVCETCGEEFYHPPSYPQDYCSDDCDPVIGTEVYEALDGLIQYRRKAAEMLIKEGYETKEDLKQAGPHKILEVERVGKLSVRKITENIDEMEVYPTREKIDLREQKEESEPEKTPSSEESRKRSTNFKVCPHCHVIKTVDEYDDHVEACEEA